MDISYQIELEKESNFPSINKLNSKKSNTNTHKDSDFDDKSIIWGKQSSDDLNSTYNNDKEDINIINNTS